METVEALKVRSEFESQLNSLRSVCDGKQAAQLFRGFPPSLEKSE